MWQDGALVQTPGGIRGEMPCDSSMGLGEPLVAWKGLKVLAKKLDCTLRKTEAPEGCRTVLTCRKADPCCV